MSEHTELLMHPSTRSMALRRGLAQRASILATVVLVACDRSATTSADATADGGSLIAAIQTEPQQLIPVLLAQIDEKTIGDQIFEPLAWLGDDGRLDGQYRPALADSWTWERDSTAIAFHLNPAARWHDGAPVRASDVRFTFGLVTDSIVGSKDRGSFARIDSVTVRDSVTPVFWFASRYPEQFYDAAARMLIAPEHVLAKEPRATLQTSAAARQPVGSGRFRFAKWVSGSSIELVADTTHYRGRPKLDRVIFTMTGDPNALTTQLAAGEIDLAIVTNPDQFRTLSANPSLTARILPAFDYTFLLFNLRNPRRPSEPHPLFADVNLRRALSMALDRALLVRSQFDSMAAVSLGPMTRAQPLADSTIPPIRYDSSGAMRLLDSLGWKIPAGKSVRERAGKPLQFKVMVPTVSRNRMTMIVRIQEALRRVGVAVDIDAIEPNAFGARQNARDFDVAFDGRHADMSVSGLRDYWSVAGSRQKGGQNFASYENPAFDAHLDSALSAADAGAARAHAKEAFETIIADAPAVWLYETRTAALIHKRFRTAHIAPTAWWAGLADWSIPPNERIPRDRVGLRVAAR